MRRAAIGLFILCAALFLAPGGTRAASFYNPCSIVSLESTAAEAPSAIATTYGVGIEPTTCAPFSSATDRPGEWLSRNVIQFTPPDWYLAADADIADGAEVGELNSRQTIGLFDNGCNQVMRVDFVLLDGTTDTTNIVEPKPHGKPHRLSPLAADHDGDGVANAVEKWPSYLTTFADQQGMDLTKLRARIVGIHTDVIGTTIVWNYLVFEPGATISNGVVVDPDLGYPTVAVFQDPTARASSGDPVSDWCAPVRNEFTLRSTVAGNETYRSNPGDGVYNFVTFSLPFADADNDGIENPMDPCPYDPNLSGWDPRGILKRGDTPGDNDVDGLPDECDLDASRSPCDSDNGAAGHDEDCDGWANRAENCPFVSNEKQEDADGDSIGDACDRSMAAEGQHAAVCNATTVIIGDGGPAPGDPHTLSPCVDHYACDCAAVGDVDCDLDIDGVDLLLTMQLIAGIGDVPCAPNAYTGCDQTLNTPEIAAILRYLVLHKLPTC